jgi:hypothetical protein
LFGGAEHIERVDSLVRRIARQRGLQSDALHEIVKRVDERLRMNRSVPERPFFAAAPVPATAG